MGTVFTSGVPTELTPGVVRDGGTSELQERQT